MRKHIAIFVMLILGLCLVTANVYASGDKVRGDEAEGPANQLGECPFTG